MRADFFLLTGRLSSNRYLAEDDIRALVDLGMGVGLHGHDHVDWRKLDAQSLHAETVAAWARLTEIIGGPVMMVSIPFGAYNRRVIAHLRSQGFAEIYTSDGGTARAGALIRARTSLRSDMSSGTIENILTARQSLCTRMRRAVSSFRRQRLV